MDSPLAAKATAHELARIIYSMVTKGVEYLGMDCTAMAKQTRQRRLKRLHSETRKFRMYLVKFVEPEKTILINQLRNLLRAEDQCVP